MVKMALTKFEKKSTFLSVEDDETMNIKRLIWSGVYAFNRDELAHFCSIYTLRN